jgi:acetyl esterase/lipase
MTIMVSADFSAGAAATRVNATVNNVTTVNRKVGLFIAMDSLDWAPLRENAWVQLPPEFVSIFFFARTMMRDPGWSQKKIVLPSAGLRFDSASGALLVNADAPPTLILQGELDVNVFHEQSALLAERLSDARVPHALVSLPWAAHAFDLVGFNTPSGQITTYSVTWFLATVTQ